MARKRRTPKGAREAAVRESKGDALQFSARNLVAGAAGLVALAAGYWLLAQGLITAAPLLLVLGYVVLLPMAILW